MKKQLLLIKEHSYNKWVYDDEFIERIKQLGYKVYVHPSEQVPYTKEELACEVFVNTFAFSYTGIENFPNLKFVHGLSAGYDHFPLEEFKKRGIHLCNIRGVYGIPISEFIISGILNIYKKAQLFEVQKKNKEFIRTPDLIELANKKAVILGTGDIGTQTAKRLQAFDVKTIGFNRHPKATQHFDEVHPISTLNDYLPDCDIVIITLPLSEETYHLADKDFFRRLNSNSIFVNVSRGAVCDENALIGALQSKSIRAAVLDVYEKEPLSQDSPLWNLHNAYMYPHTMTGSDNAFNRMKDLIYRNLKAYIEGTAFENQIF